MHTFFHTDDKATEKKIKESTRFTFTFVVIKSVERSQQLDLWWRRGPTPITMWFVTTGPHFWVSITKSPILIKPFMCLIWSVNCHLNPEDLDPRTPQKHPPPSPGVTTLNRWQFSLTDVWELEKVNVSVSLAVVKRQKPGGLCYQAGCQIGHLRPAYTWKQEVCGWCLNLLMI